MRCYGVEDGLPQDSITDIAINTDDQLLVATYSGVVIFDGQQFLKKIPGTTKDFPAVEAFSLGIDTDGIIWIGTTSSGLYRIKDQSVTNWNIKKGLQAQIINKILLTDDGILINNDGHIASINDQDQLNYHEPSTNTGVFLQTFQDISKRLLITSSNQTPQSFPIYTDDLVKNRLSKSQQNHIFLAQNGQIFRIKDGEKTLIIEQLLPNTSVSITKLMLDKNNHLWIATATNGLFRYSDLGIEAFNHLPNNRLSSIVEDQDGAIWVGTSGGLCMLKVGAIKNIGMRQGLDNENIHALGIDTSDNVYLIPYEKTSTLTHINQQTIFNNPLVLPQNQQDGIVINAIKQENNNLWIASNRYINLLIDNTLIPIIKLESKTRALLVKDEVFWYQEHNHLIKNHKGVKTIIPLNTNTLIDIKAMSFALNGDVLVAEERHLYRIHNDQATEINIPVEAASCIYEFRAGEMWVCDGGLWLRTPQGDHHFSKKNNLTNVISGHIHDVIHDKHGNIWALSNSGLFRILRHDINHLKSSTIDTLEFIKFSEKDGMKSSEFNGSSSGAVTTRDGKLWFASQGGVVLVDPDLALFYSEKKLTPYVEKFYIGDQLIASDQWLAIKPNPKAIQMHFTAIFLSDAQNISYRYKLMPHQDQWKTGQTANFTELNPGQYQLHLQARYYQNKWSEVLQKTLIVLPAWYQTWLFRILASLVVIALIFGVPLWRIQRLKRHKVILKKLVEEKTESLLKANDKLDQMTRLDELTGIANRRDFINNIEKYCKDVEKSFALALIDIDDFKAYNDYYGHIRGDECLTQVANILDNNCHEHGFVARFGGEEFVILFNSQNIHNCAKVINDTYQQLQQTNIPHDRSTVSSRITLSTGLVLRSAGESVEKIIDRADMAMYKAKSTGKNQLNIEH